MLVDDDLVHLLDAFPVLAAYMTRMYERPKAPPCIAVAFASVRKPKPSS